MDDQLQRLLVATRIRGRLDDAEAGRVARGLLAARHDTGSTASSALNRVARWLEGALASRRRSKSRRRRSRSTVRPVLPV